MTRSYPDYLRVGGLGYVWFTVMCLVGCGGQEMGVVKGTVTWNNKPIVRGMISFIPDSGPPYSAAIIDGLYDTGEIPTGDYRCTIVLTEGPPGESPTPPPKRAGSSFSEGLGPADLRSPNKAVRAFDTKYCNPATSGLTYTVKPGPNTYDPPNL